MELSQIKDKINEPLSEEVPSSFQILNMKNDSSESVMSLEEGEGPLEIIMKREIKIEKGIEVKYHTEIDLKEDVWENEELEEEEEKVFTVMQDPDVVRTSTTEADSSNGQYIKGMDLSEVQKIIKLEDFSDDGDAIKDCSSFDDDVEEEYSSDDDEDIAVKEENCLYDGINKKEISSEDDTIKEECSLDDVAIDVNNCSGVEDNLEMDGGYEEDAIALEENTSDDYNRLKCAYCKNTCNDLDDSFGKQLGSFCDECYKTLRKNLKREWLKKLYQCYETCTICLNTLNNDLHIIQHDCTCEHFYCCNYCNLILDRKTYLINHLKYCGIPNNITVFDDVTKNDVVKNVTGSSVNFITKCSSSDDVSYEDSTEISRHVSDSSSQVIGKAESPTSTTNKKYPLHSLTNNICKYCKRLFKSFSKLTEHLLTHTRKRCFTCKICKKSFTRSSQLKSHLRIHSGEKPYSCKICKKSFTQSSQLKSHLMFHSREKPYSCEICEKSFKWSHNLKYHLRVHSGEKQYTCEMCKKSFKRSNELKYHLRIHSGEKPYLCEICEKSFKWSCDLKCHLRIHSGEKPYSCEICKKSFTQSGSLKSHLRIHSGEKPYSCEICKKSFTESGLLKIHLRIHSGEKLYSCKICKKSFKWSHNLKYHLRVHSGEKPYSCEICKKSFTRSHNLKYHLRIHSGEKPYTCEICKKSFKRSHHLKYHLRVHSGKKPSSFGNL